MTKGYITKHSVVNGPAWSDLRPKSNWTDERSSRTGPN